MPKASTGKPDYKTAAQWFRKAAEHGIADSQYNLGILYARGIGVEQNLAESYKWFSLAAAQGDQRRRQEARRCRRAARRRGSLMAATLAVQSFAPEPQPDEASHGQDARRRLGPRAGGAGHEARARSRAPARR